MKKKWKILLVVVCLIIATTASIVIYQKTYQKNIVVKNKSIVQQGLLQFKDLNGNGELDAYEDWRLSSRRKSKRFSETNDFRGKSWYAFDSFTI